MLASRWRPSRYSSVAKVVKKCGNFVTCFCYLWFGIRALRGIRKRLYWYFLGPKSNICKWKPSALDTQEPCSPLKGAFCSFQRKNFFIFVDFCVCVCYLSLSKILICFFSVVDPNPHLLLLPVWSSREKGPKQERNFMFWIAWSSLLGAEGFSCSLDLLYVRINKWQFLS